MIATAINGNRRGYLPFTKLKVFSNLLFGFATFSLISLFVKDSSLKQLIASIDDHSQTKIYDSLLLYCLIM